MATIFRNKDGWWNKYIKNTGPVEYPTMYNKPHWQCTKCDFNDEDMATVRQHVYKKHDNPVRKDTVGAFYGLDDSMGG